MASIRERNGKFNVIYSYTNEKGERKQKWETYCRLPSKTAICAMFGGQCVT